MHLNLPLLSRELLSPRKIYIQQFMKKLQLYVYSLVQNHPFLDGNKRVGHAAMETFLLLNGYEIISDTAEQEALILNLASGKINREFLTVWLKSHTKQK